VAPITGTMMPKRSASRPHQHGAEDEADHCQSVGHGGIGAGDAELGLHRWQGDDDRPHADAADGAERDRGDEAGPGVAGFDFTHGPSLPVAERDGHDRPGEAKGRISLHSPVRHCKAQ
jgi:hypothetical protein